MVYDILPAVNNEASKTPRADGAPSTAGLSFC